MALEKTRKSLWYSFRENHPRLHVKFGSEFKSAVRSTLVKHIGLKPPFSANEDEFINKEVTVFTKQVPYFWQKSNRVVKTMFAKHPAFFDKSYPVFREPAVNPLKRPHESKSRFQQWRDKVKITKEVDKDALISSSAYCFLKEGHVDAAYIVKRLLKEPRLGTDLRKTVDDMDSKSEKRLNLV